MQLQLRAHDMELKGEVKRLNLKEIGRHAVSASPRDKNFKRFLIKCSPGVKDVWHLKGIISRTCFTMR
jgi:hypothetical protein